MHAHRLDAYRIAPAGMQALRAVEDYLHQSTLGASLIELVKMRASQINGCAYCLDMHSKALRKGGETEQRIYLLSGWRESPLYSPRERAALAWTDALTRIAETQAPDDVYDEVRRHFDDKEIVDLTTLIGMINLWNRLAISLRYEHPAG
ncbi:MAG: carboxymuconolactone decarboxylase family protein [Alphaproteobacteria bacterium]|nr:carboxymuconolactone decarboxylase family protein [Alphaproteobacteria bacterium]MBV9554827.1 carboxymuconolactone decarboxylase family protein [Alphaproteobacteria bacterium]